MRIAAEGVVEATPEAVFRFLSDLSSHWRLAGRWVEAVELNGDGGRVRMKGPLGVRRTAVTRVVSAEPHHRVTGTAEVGGGTRATVSWEMHEDARGCLVRLVADVERASPLDQLLLGLGGRAWMQRRFEQVLASLSEAL